MIFLGGVILFPILKIPKPIALLLALATASWVTWLSLNLIESNDETPRPQRKPTRPEDTLERDEPPY